jgi:hypothetical protein
MADVERIQQLTPGTLAQQWYEDGSVADPGSVTVGITRADGTTLVAAGTATSGSGTAPRTFNLTTTHTTLLDRLMAPWTSTTKGTQASYVEVVGGFLCSLADLKPLFPSATASELADIRTDAEQALEDECGQAFVPRYARETLDGDGSVLVLKYPNVRAIRSASYTYGGIVTPLTISQLGYLAFNPSGILTGYSWPSGTGNVTVAYEHGRDYAPPGAKPAVLAAAQEIHGTSTGDGRVIRREADGQAVTYASASSSGGFLDPALRAFVARNSHRALIA